MPWLEKVLAALVLIALAPLFPVLWILNRLEDGGAVFYRQARLGKGRIAFSILKLRTMQNGRITRLGSLLRPAGIDELPQFYNVLRGEMRLIGPRPVTAEDTMRWNWTETDPRWNVSPGMSGLPGVLGTRRGRDALRLERFYAIHQSAKLDLTLLGTTFVMLFLGKHRVRGLKTIARRQFSQSRRNRQNVIRCSNIKINRPLVPWRKGGLLKGKS
jgi:lipopolysaccharide/colanic/teichoic acid biosynthesis glycosyltransferase